MKSKGIVTPYIILITLAIIVLIGIGVYLSQNGVGGNGVTTPSPTPTPVGSPTLSPSPTATSGDALSPDLTPTPTPDEVAEWELFSSEDIGFRILYPPEVRVERPTDDTVSFIQFGPTQRTGTEFYDGISLAFDSGSLGDMTLQEFVQQRVQSLQDNPVVEEITESQPITVASYQGYTFEVTSLGTRSYIFLPQGEDRYLEIVNNTEDPTGQGFEETIDTMLSTLRIFTQ
ncbi:MAG: hypothetical protein ACOX6V_01325 [Patescibacteria group bacterium]|jgi:hypothetical protein